MKRLIISIVVAFTLVLGLLPTAVLAGTSGSSSGSFSVQHETPVINSVGLYDSPGSTQLYSMDPLTQYQFKVDITDLNSIGNLTSLNVVIFYLNGTPSWPGPQVLLNGTGSGTTIPVSNTSSFTNGHVVRIADTASNEYATITGITTNTSLTVTTLGHTYTVANNAAVTDMGNMPVTPNSQNCVSFTWTQTLGVWTAASSYLSVASGDTGSSTWTFPSYTLPTSNAASEFVFTGNFIPGKVATATAGAGEWYIRARVTDAQNYDTRAYSSALTMTSYDEIDLGTTTLNWGTVIPGLGFGSSAKAVTVKFIANGNYDKYVSSNNWTGYRYTATLDPSGSPSSTDNFSLKAVLGSYNGYVSSTGSWGTLIDSSGGLTYEAGDNPASSMALALYSTFDTDTYGGTITYTITTR